MNPFQNAKIVSHNADQEKYRAQFVERGHPEFTMSSGALKQFASCASRWKNNYNPPTSEAQSWGSVFDCAALTPGQFEARFVCSPETYSDSKTGELKPWTMAANYCKEWKSKNADREIIKAAVMADVEAALAALKSDPQIDEILKVSFKQVWVTADYRDAQTGIIVPVKGLLDLVPPADHPKFGKAILDLKTVTSAHPRAWVNAVDKYGYDCQASFYLDLYVAATGEDRCDFRHILSENYAPWQTAKRWLSAEFLSLGRFKYLSALSRYCRCLESGHWPDYDESGRMVLDGWRETEPPPWLLTQQLETMSQDRPATLTPKTESDDLMP